MKVFLTGANGFVGSHILDELVESGHEVVVLLRRTSDTRFISTQLNQVVIHYGSLLDTSILTNAMSGVDVVVHCAAKTKAFHASEYDDTNVRGTDSLVTAVKRAESVEHIVYVSTIAVTGPATPDRPARESDAPNPCTPYARSKLAGEIIIGNQTTTRWTSLRLAGVYGTRDTDFLPAFRAAKRGFIPLPAGRSQSLSLIFGRDAARAVRQCLGQHAAFAKVYNVAADPPCTSEAMAHAVAQAIGKNTRTIPLPGPVVYTACLFQDWMSQIRGRPHILSRQKYPELRASGWVCSTERIRDDLGFIAPTSLADGLAQTADWYKREGLL